LQAVSETESPGETVRRWPSWSFVTLVTVLVVFAAFIVLGIALVDHKKLGSYGDEPVVASPRIAQPLESPQ
jgi:hypothetical protein